MAGSMPLPDLPASSPISKRYFDCTGLTYEFKKLAGMIGQSRCAKDHRVTEKVTVDISRNSPIFRRPRDLRNRQERSATEQCKHSGSGWAISVLCAFKLCNRGKSWQLILFDSARGWHLLALGAKPDGKEKYCESEDS
jgi:hypothetical protein